MAVDDFARRRMANLAYGLWLANSGEWILLEDRERYERAQARGT